MLKLDTTLTLDRAAIKAGNLCDRFTDADLKRIGTWVVEGYRQDKQSRFKWERRNEAGMDLAMQLQKDKNFPWPGCSNVAFPLVTIGALQFHAKAYPSLIQGTEVVKMRVVGDDPDGAKTARARKVGTFMSQQVMEVDQPWEEQHDRGWLNKAVVGCNFYKHRWDFGIAAPRTELVLARDFVIDYFAKSVEATPRSTHLIPYFKNDIRERVLEGVFRDVLDESWFNSPSLPLQTQQEIRADQRKGLTQPARADETTPFVGLEQHVDVDLDGDGYAESYIITVEERSQATLRIVTAFSSEDAITRVQVGKRRGEIISVKKECYFTKDGFIPSPDGGIYDIGFGVLLGPLNESVNTLVNQLIDAGTWNNQGGGFLGRGAKIRGGVVRAAPGEFIRIDATGDDLAKSLVPFPKTEPSTTLFQLLSLLIDYVNRISGATDAVVGINPGQNTPAETQRSMVEMGMKIYTAIFKRTWRSMKEEFKKLYILNGIYLPEGRFGPVQRSDFLGDPNQIVPAADPNIVSDQAQMNQAQALYSLAKTEPGFNMPAVIERVLAAMKVEGVKEIYQPEKAAPPAEDPKVQIEKMRTEVKMEQLKGEHFRFIAELQEEQRVNDAKITELMAKASLEMESAGGVAEGHKIALFEAAIGALKLHSEHIGGMIQNALKHKELTLKEKELEQSAAELGGVGGGSESSGGEGDSGVGAEAA